MLAGESAARPTPTDIDPAAMTSRQPLMRRPPANAQHLPANLRNRDRGWWAWRQFVGGDDMLKLAGAEPARPASFKRCPGLANPSRISSWVLQCRLPRIANRAGRADSTHQRRVDGRESGTSLLFDVGQSRQMRTPRVPAG